MSSSRPIPRACPSLFLVGFMAAGKTTVGRCLAPRLCLPFFDLDALIESTTSQSIAQIFSQQGESAFRRLERSVLRRIPLPAVVALGGGSFCQKPIRTFTRLHGISVFLDWPFQVLMSRLHTTNHSRCVPSSDESHLSMPHMAGQKPVSASLDELGPRPLAWHAERLKALHQNRIPCYRSADLVWRSRPPHESSSSTIADWITSLLLPTFRNPA